MTTPLSLDSRVTPVEAVRLRHLGDEAVALHLGTSQLYTLDETAARMWSAIAEAESLRGARDELLGHFDVEPQRLEDDLLAFAVELVELGLLEVATV